MLTFDELWNVDQVEPVVKGMRPGGIAYNGAVIKLYDKEGTDKKLVSLASLTKAMTGRVVPIKSVNHIIKGEGIPWNLGRGGNNRMTVLDAHDAIKIISYYKETIDTEEFENFIDFFKKNIFEKLVQ